MYLSDSSFRIFFHLVCVCVLSSVQRYGSHCNSPRKHEMGLSMPQKGLAMFQMDLEGHGYSGGERAYIEDYKHWVEDFRLVRALRFDLFFFKAKIRIRTEKIKSKQ